MGNHHGNMDMKHVQTELPDGVYEGLSRVARRKGRSLKEVTREAIESYVQAAEDPAQDPLLDFIGRGSLEDEDWSERKDWRTSGGR